jgi:sulfate adenylyltransferase subunit 1 (EFTu-like GTPase family)
VVFAPSNLPWVKSPNSTWDCVGLIVEICVGRNTCGSVDDGKSTLIGRLLFESKAIFDDQLAALVKDSAQYGTQGSRMDLALLVDGLQAGREQGITIDVGRA